MEYSVLTSKHDVASIESGWDMGKSLDRVDSPADIKKLTEHFKANKQDIHSRRGLTRKVSLRRKLLKYLKRKNLDMYRQLVERLELREGKE